MAFDALFLEAVVTELQEKLTGGRLEKIHQPGRDQLLLLFRCQEGREKLLITPNPAAPRLHLTASSPENPPEPPMFCMLLRKHLLGARLSDIRQLPLERWVELTFQCVNELGDPTQKRLTVELMGRTCNIYLLDAENRILDCLRRVGLDEASRPALPGMYYQPPEAVTKLDPRTADLAALLAQPGADLLCDRLMDTLGGLSPLVCREAALAAAGDPMARLEGADKAAIAQRLQAFFAHPPAPWLYTDATGKPKQFAWCPIRQYGSCEEKPSFGQLMDSFYTVRDRMDAIWQKGQAIRKTVNNLCQRLTRKLAIQEQELQATYDRERLRQLGDILTANIHRIQKGQTRVQVEDFYDPEMAVITVELSPILSPQQNAAKFYKDYTRMKNAEKELTHQLEVGRQELSYLQSVREELDRAASEAELEEIRQELQASGYLRQDTGKRRMKQQKLRPMQFTSTDGFPIFVGRNNLQNEELTFKSARKDDLWLHAQKVHGSHVIIACGGKKPPDDTVTQAAQLAAYYSGSTGGQNIPVDVTPVRQVKKLPGGKPGMVIYHTYSTVIVNPYPDIVVDPLNAETKPEE